MILDKVLSYILFSFIQFSLFAVVPCSNYVIHCLYQFTLCLLFLIDPTAMPTVFIIDLSDVFTLQDLVLEPLYVWTCSKQTKKNGGRGSMHLEFIDSQRYYGWVWTED